MLSLLPVLKCFRLFVPTERKPDIGSGSLAYLVGEAVMQETPGHSLLQLAHPGGFLVYLGEDFVQLYSPPLDNGPLDLGSFLLVSRQQGALELLQEGTALEELLENQPDLSQRKV